MYSRARVALTLSHVFPTLGMPDAVNLTPIHVGHARTLLLGSLVAQHYGCPFHIRLDGPYRDPNQVPPLIVDRGDAILELLGCLRAMGVSWDQLYWCPQEPTSLLLAKREGLARIKAGWAMGDIRLAQILDDAVDHAPSLIVRGGEFALDGDTTFAGVAHLGQFVATEEMVYCALGEQKHEFTAPMVFLGPGKMSKSKLTVVPWQVLTSLPPEGVRRFLLATAMRPDDPLAAFDDPFSLDHLDPRPYRWDWKQWAQAVKRG